MATKFYVLLVLFFYGGDSTTTITSVPSSSPSETGWWDDDYLWTDGNSVDGSTVDTWFTSQASGDLGGTSTCDVCFPDKWDGSDTVHGWYADAENVQQYSIERIFQCTTQATVEYQFKIYFCVESGDSDDFYIDRIPGTLAAGVNNEAFHITSSSVNENDPAYVLERSSNSDQPGTTCSADIKYTNFSDSYLAKPYDSGTISIRQENLNGDNNAIAWNNFRIRCLQEITQPPTRAPTDVTKDPTKAPSKYPTPAPTGNPTPAPTDLPTRNPTTHQPTETPTLPIPTKSPTRAPSAEPTKTPTMDPTENPTMKPTTSTTAQPTKNPVIPDDLIDDFGKAFGGGDDCDDGWIACNLVVFIILLIVGICIILYWIIGGVWFKKRQDTRPVPAHMLVGTNNTSANVVGNTSVEMGGNTAGPAHVTSDRWKSAWEIEQEQKAAAAAAQQNQGGGAGAGGDAVYGNAGGGGGGGAPGYY